MILIIKNNLKIKVMFSNFKILIYFRKKNKFTYILLY